MKKKIFISHAYKDKGIATRIVDKIIIPLFSVDKQSDIFFTSRRNTGIKSSANWRNKIKQELIDCEIFISLITPNYKKSEMCVGEVGAAWVQNKVIYSLILPPIKYENFSIILSDLQADILIKREDVKAFIESIADDLNRLYNVEFRENIDKEKQITSFLKSIKQYLHKNPNLFLEPIEVVEDKKNVVAHLKKPALGDTSIIKDIDQEELKRTSIEEWPDDYSMQEYHVNEQIEAHLNLGEMAKEIANIPEKIRVMQKAIKEWPKDYSMQLYKAKEQLEALNRLRKNS
jgi:hypothetical protein